MKIFRRHRLLPAMAGCLACLSATSCEDTLKLRSDAAALQAKFDALQAESNQLDAQINELRKSLPMGSNPAEGARQLHTSASGELTLLEANLKSTAAQVKETEAAVAALKKQQQPATE